MNSSGSGSSSNNNDDSPSSSFSDSSSYYRELEKDILSHGLTDIELYSGNRALIALGDFFYDDYTAREYERGIMLKGRREFVGKSITVSRNRINHLLSAYCGISGLGTFKVSYSVAWVGDAEPEHIQELMAEKKQNPKNFLLDTRLCMLLVSQTVWKYMVADLEKTNEETGVLLG